MVAKKSNGKLFVYNILVLMLFFGLIKIFINGGGNFFILELSGFLFLVLLTLIGFIGYSKRWGEKVLFFMFLFYLINLTLIWYYTNTIWIILLLIGIVGFILSIPKKAEVKSKSAPMMIEPEEPHSQVFEVEPTKEEKVKKVKHSPGKYVASKRSNIYHEPKCDWAKKIKKEHQTWFASKEEAWEQGYKGHSCVE